MNQDFFHLLKSYVAESWILSLMQTCQAFYVFTNEFEITSFVPLIWCKRIPKFYKIHHFSHTIHETKSLYEYQRCRHLRLRIEHHVKLLKLMNNLVTLHLDCHNIVSNGLYLGILPHLRRFTLTYNGMASTHVKWLKDGVFHLQMNEIDAAYLSSCYEIKMFLPEQLTHLRLCIAWHIVHEVELNHHSPVIEIV